MTYLLRPLLFYGPHVQHRRFEEVTRRFKKEVNGIFKDFELNRENADFLLWYTFNPELQFKNLKIHFSSGHQYVSGNVAVVRFAVNGKAINYLPDFDQFMGISERPASNKNIDEGEIISLLEKLIRQKRKELKADFDINDYYSGENNFVSTLSMNLAIEQGPMKFLKNNNTGFFTFTHQSQIFKGAQEITKIGNELNIKYPGNLQRAHLREPLVERIYDLTWQEQNTPFVLVGPKGVGKQSIIEEAVFRYLQQRKDDKTLKDSPAKKLWQFDPNRVIAGMSIVGWWQKRTEAILDFVMKRKEYANLNLPPDILLTDNSVALLRIGQSAQNSMTLSDLLKPYVENRSLQLILLATPSEWKVVQEKDRRFADLFQIIRVAEPDYKTAVKIVLENRRSLEVKQGCSFTINAVSQLLNLHRTYLNQQALPGSVLRLMNQLSTKYRYQTIDVPEIRSEFEELSRLNEYIFDSNIQLQRAEIKKFIDARLIGQSDAVDALTDVISLVKAKLNTPGKPLGSFLFIGPTGVGKTQAAKVLSEYLMDSETELTRFDMNEFNTPGSVDRLIGDYFNPNGLLTEKLRYQPFHVLLLDEIEKAHPVVHDLLLQLLDDGRITDSLGRTVNCSNIIVIMTSNIGAQEVSMRLGYDTSSRNDAAIYRKAMENHFRPEFINRIDRVVVFDPLRFEDILSIARIQIKELLQRDGFVRRTMMLNIAPNALEWVAQRGFDEKMGGRALKRQIEKDLTALSAEHLIASHSNLPMIFEILWEDGRLVPRITPLAFAKKKSLSPLPSLPHESKGRSFYNKLIRVLEKVETQIRFLDEKLGIKTVIQPEGDYDWMYYAFKDQLSQLKQTMKDRALGYGSEYFRSNKLPPLNLKSSPDLIDELTDTSNLDDEPDSLKYLDPDALSELKAGYPYQSSRFNEQQTEFLIAGLDVVFLKLFARGFLSQKIDSITLKFSSLTDLDHREELEGLKKTYATLLDKLDIQYTQTDQTINVKWYGIGAFFKGENGIHLFHRSHRSSILIRLEVIDNSSPPSSVSGIKIIRVYQKDAILYDLRTRFTNPFPPSPPEWKVLLAAGITDLPSLD